MWCLIGMLSCQQEISPSPAEGPVDSAEPAQDSLTPADTAPAPPEDRDSDGVLSDEDCDDLDPRVAPGLEEVWDDLDNDCDGWVDGQGTFQAVWTFEADAVYKGAPYSWTLDCSMELQRGERSLSWEGLCEKKDPDDPEAYAFLIGEQLRWSVYPGDESAEEAAWGGWVELVSSAGWSSVAEAELTWLDMDQVEGSWSLEGVWLQMAGAGALSRVESVSGAEAR